VTETEGLWTTWSWSWAWTGTDRTVPKVRYPNSHLGSDLLYDQVVQFELGKVVELGQVLELGQVELGQVELGQVVHSELGRTKQR
jgi:hypothetical protein